MALTYSPALEALTCPEFSLGSVDQKVYSLEDFSESKALVIMFICNHCPYVRAIEDRLLNLAREMTDVAFVGICSNDPAEHPEDEPAALFHRWREKDYPFPYLIDNTQEVGRRFGAVCTPDIFVFDETRKLRYRGRLDDSWKNAELVTKQELRMALDALRGGRVIPEPQIPSMGCSIKWKNA